MCAMTLMTQPTFFFFFFFFFFPMQFYLQLQHLLYLQYLYYTNIYTCTTLQYDTKKKKLKKIRNYLQYNTNATKKDSSTTIQLLTD